MTQVWTVECVLLLGLEVLLILFGGRERRVELIVLRLHLIIVIQLKTSSSLALEEFDCFVWLILSQILRLFGDGF